MSPNAGGGVGVAGAGGRSPNKVWRSNSMFNLCPRIDLELTCCVPSSTQCGRRSGRAARSLSRHLEQIGTMQDPGSRISDPGSDFFPSPNPGSEFLPSRVPDPNFFHPESQIRMKKFKYFNPENYF
jgi:hypothetical protein